MRNARPNTEKHLLYNSFFPLIDNFEDFVSETLNFLAPQRGSVIKSFVY
jgi:hypothetical protein